jgi:hypothetical protein
MKKRKTIEVANKVLLFYKKQASKTIDQSAKSLMERDLTLIAQGHKIMPKANADA